MVQVLLQGKRKRLLIVFDGENEEMVRLNFGWVLQGSVEVLLNTGLRTGIMVLFRKFYCSLFMSLVDGRGQLGETGVFLCLANTFLRSS